MKKLFLVKATREYYTWVEVEDNTTLDKVEALAKKNLDNWNIFVFKPLENFSVESCWTFSDIPKLDYHPASIDLKFCSVVVNGVSIRDAIDPI